jgi:plasmid stabilization system protein ParE
MTNVNWSPPALTDLNHQNQFLAAVNPEAGIKAVLAIVLAARSLGENPKRGTPIADTPGLRKLLVKFGKYGYIIHYVILDEEVLILRVYHGRQNRPS